MSTNPGTVSEILWHFTGGPKWNSELNEQEVTPKPAEEAFDNLVKILSSQTVRLGAYREVVHIECQKAKYYNPEFGTQEFKFGESRFIESAPVCCIAEIPPQYLEFHAERYGQFAIGFWRDEASKHGFNPVLYTPRNSDVLQSIYQSFIGVDAYLAAEMPEYLDLIRKDIELNTCEFGHPMKPTIASLLFGDAEGVAININNANDLAREEFKRFLVYVKTLKPEEFSTIYCEREWRSPKKFEFHPSEVAWVLAPQDLAGVDFRQRLIELAEAGTISRDFTIRAWEDRTKIADQGPSD